MKLGNGLLVELLLLIGFSGGKGVWDPSNNALAGFGGLPVGGVFVCFFRQFVEIILLSLYYLFLLLVRLGFLRRRRNFFGLLEYEV